MRKKYTIKQIENLRISFDPAKFAKFVGNGATVEDANKKPCRKKEKT